MTNGCRNIVLYFLFNCNCLPILAFCAIKVILFLKSLPKMVMSKPNKFLFIAHFIECQASHEVVTRHSQFGNRLVAQTYLHILFSKASTITLHSLQGL